MPSKKRLTRLTQALPDVRIIPRVRFRSWGEVKKGIRVHPNVADELERIAFEAYARAHKKAVADYDNNISIAVIRAPIKAANAAAHFVSEKEFETTRPVFRRLIANTGKASLKRAAISLLEKMPRDGSPPFPQMRELASASEWRTKLSPAIVREMLGRWVELMNDLNSMTGSGPVSPHGGNKICWCTRALLEGRAWRQNCKFQNYFHNPTKDALKPRL